MQGRKKTQKNEIKAGGKKKKFWKKETTWQHGTREKGNLWKIGPTRRGDKR